MYHRIVRGLNQESHAERKPNAAGRTGEKPTAKQAGGQGLAREKSSPRDRIYLEGIEESQDESHALLVTSSLLGIGFLRTNQL
jgi:hypothetical protein